MSDYSGVVVAIVMAVALVSGLIANKFVRPFAKTEVQGVKLETLVGPIVSLTVLMLAFTLVTIYGSFLRAQTAASDEARKVDYGGHKLTLSKGPLLGLCSGVRVHLGEIGAPGRDRPGVLSLPGGHFSPG